MPTVVIVDTDAAHRSIARVIAEETGWEVAEAGSVEDAVGVARRLRPELVLSLSAPDPAVVASLREIDVSVLVAPADVSELIAELRARRRSA
jgi:DNA-binding response OmpR family regulator